MVDRPDPLSRPGSPRKTGPTAGPAPPPPRFGVALAIIFGVALAIIAVLELAWLGWFLYVQPPNVPKVGDVPFRRGYLLLKAFPEVVPDTPFSESMLGKGLDEMSHLENLPQRLPVILAAALIAAAAIGLGDAVLGRLRIRAGLRMPERIALAYGLGAAGLGGLTMIAGRMGWIDPRLIRIGLAILASLPILRVGLRRIRSRPVEAGTTRSAPDRRDPLAWFFGLLIAPFVTITILGSMLPATDFDVLEYHLEGPKEYFQAGRIAFLPHNVYTNMPFDVEMLHLLGMSVMGDWWWGALAGQLLVSLFGPATAVLIYATAARASPRAGWIAALVYLSAPWVYRIGVIAYVEGPLCFYHMAMVWAWLSGKPDREDGSGRCWPLLGLLAGGAMGCKYTALVSAVIPFGLLALVDVSRRRSLGPLLAFGLGWAVIMAPWLIKNVIDTGDPVYPLGYRVFHGHPWDDARERQWQQVHGPKPFSWGELARSFVEMAGRSDWQSPLFAALAPLALLRPGSRREARFLWGFAAYLFAEWFFLTHRLDRFWLPILPILAVLAGMGADWVRHPAWSFLVLSPVLAIGLLTNLVYDSSALAGLNEWTGDLNHLRRNIPDRLNRPLAALDERLPPDARVLLVGQAAVFHLVHPIVYNTVFNDETIEVLARGRDVEGLRKALRDRKLTHIYVDWKEIQRHRQPGGYGFTDYVTRDRFASWVAAGLLDRPVAFGAEQELYRIR